MHVPASQIHVLLNEQATRSEIRKYIEDLTSSSDIRLGDPILIFYAGHGAQTNSPNGWQAGGGSHPQIQMICPHDFLPRRSDVDDAQGIPDMTLAILLNHLSKAKGDNITVIFDCCHSGSGTREESYDPEVNVRGIDLPQDYVIAPTADNDLLREENSRGDRVMAGYEVSGSRSHVLLAACRADERSREDGSGGLFTRALLETLNTEGTDKTTYEGLIDCIPDITGQNPQCEGFHKSRILFDSKAHSSRHKLLKVTKAKSRSYMLECGEAFGITLNSQFDVYKSKNLESLPVGILTARSISAFSARCEVAPNVPDLPLSSSCAAYALQTRADTMSGIRMSIADEPLFLDIITLVRDEIKHGLRIRLVVEDASPLPDIALVTNGDNTVTFDINDKLCRDRGMTHMYYPVHLDPTTTSSRDSFTEKILTIVRSAADFYFHLGRYPTYDGLRRSGLVRLEAYELEEGWVGNDWGMAEKEPQRNLIQQNALSVYDEDEKVFGFKVVNDSHVPLYAALFFFDMSDLSIKSYYEPSAARSSGAEHSVAAKGELTIGHGAGGGQPRQYYVRQGQEVDVGYLKLFISTKWVDYSQIAQPSPFQGGKQRRLKSRPAKGMIWDAVCVSVVQLRGRNT
ncbi:uncharacterized protein STEHIDRAFT_163203 [Stereum hirsutum FP-91666 SS1]|uniref:Peptidase C14 caspase domain-containing protein n=1 Tax=Stereum hirsutum (strain FP-91666) TaxID=721885 RepID=R7RYP6_STEHR|nr:uncharacterized protein STEHIDRAFT_163203 [Stereum hirsutum FP-91666 SS1]EIM79948.1 hypothetical protein STEHIDRAFT_163203 [Stereum hirsutum FP-91666 SS1]